MPRAPPGRRSFPVRARSRSSACPPARSAQVVDQPQAHVALGLAVVALRRRRTRVRRRRRRAASAAGAGRHVHAHRVGLRVLGHVAQRLARHPVDELVVAVGRAARRRAAPCARRRRRSGLSRSPSAASSPAVARFGGWISTSSVRSSRTPWRSRAVAARSVWAWSASPRRSASSASGARPKATPARSCTTPSWRSAAMRRRSWADASTALCQQLLALAVAALQPPRQRPGQRAPGTAGGPASPARSGGASARSRPLPARADRAEALVDLEQHRRAVRACGSACRPRAACPPGARAGSRAGSGR